MSEIIPLYGVESVSDISNKYSFFETYCDTYDYIFLKH